MFWSHPYELSSYLALILPIVFGSFAIIETAVQLWNPLAVVFYAPLVVLGMGMLIGVAISSDDKLKDQLKYIMIYGIIGVLSVIVGLSQISRHLDLWFGGFTANQTGYWHWLRFGIANILEAILFDIPTIYQWNVSEIQATAIWSQSFVLVIRTIIEFLVVTQMFRLWGVVRKTWRGSHPEVHTHYINFLFTNIKRLMAFGVWSIPMAVILGAIVNDNLSWSGTETAIRHGVPVIFGLWLTWKSIEAFFVISGIWSKMLAISVIIFGIWISQETWIALITFIRSH